MLSSTSAIARFLDPALAVLLLNYVTLVRCVERDLARHLDLPGHKDYATYLAVRDGKRLSGRAVRDGFAATVQRFGLPYTISVYRHIAIGLARVHCNVFEGVTASLGSSFFALQAGHTLPTDLAVYGTPGGGSTNTDNDGTRRQYAFVSSSWQFYILALPAPKAFVNLLERLGRIGSSRAGVPTPVHDTPPPPSPPQPSASWPGPDFDNDPTATDVSLAGTASNVGPLSVGAVLAALDRAVPEVDVVESILPALVTLYGAHARPRSRLQLEGLVERARNARDVLVVSATGSGKTALIIAPVLLPGFRGVTVVFLPTVALVQQTAETIAAAGLACTVFGANGLDGTCPDPGIVLVQAEHANKDRLTGFLADLHANGLLHSLVYDEVHLFLAARAEFRLALRAALRARAGLPVPITLLTATLPPSLERPLALAVGLPSSHRLHVVRGSSVRSNIRLVVRRCASDDDALSAAVLYARFLAGRIAQSPEAPDDGVGASSGLSQAPPTAPPRADLGDGRIGGLHRVIIFCRTIPDAVALHAALADFAELYTSKCTDDDRKLAIRRWKAGNSYIMVATSGYGVGIDLRGGCVVVHVVGSHCALDYAQEMGRAGRDGSPAASVVFWVPRGPSDPSAPQPHLPDSYPGTALAPASFDAWAGGRDRCRVAMLAALVDEAFVEPCLCPLGELAGDASGRRAAPCDVCAPTGDRSLPFLAHSTLQPYEVADADTMQRFDTLHRLQRAANLEDTPTMDVDWSTTTRPRLVPDASVVAAAAEQARVRNRTLAMCSSLTQLRQLWATRCWICAVVTRGVLGDHAASTPSACPTVKAQRLCFRCMGPGHTAGSVACAFQQRIQFRAACAYCGLPGAATGISANVHEGGFYDVSKGSPACPLEFVKLLPLLVLAMDGERGGVALTGPSRLAQLTSSTRGPRGAVTRLVPDSAIVSPSALMSYLYDAEWTNAHYGIPRAVEVALALAAQLDRSFTAPA